MVDSGVAPLQAIKSPAWEQAGVALYVLRLDQWSPQLSGNKYFKLRDNIQFALDNKYSAILSFGGAYSNHIHALAQAGRLFNLPTIGMIRGEPAKPLNATLQDATDAGMELHYLTREQYRQRNSSEFLRQLQLEFPSAYIVPEGGSNLLGAKGCMAIIDHISAQLDSADVIALACGSGGTLSGVVAGSRPDQVVLGFSALKNAQYLDAECRQTIAQLGDSDGENWQLFHDCHHGGYAKLSTSLVQFMETFTQKHAIPLDPVYTGKMFYGLYEQLVDGHPALKPGAKVVAIHTGGLQGARGMEAKVDRLRQPQAIVTKGDAQSDIPKWLNDV